MHAAAFLSALGTDDEGMILNAFKLFDAEGTGIINSRA